MAYTATIRPDNLYEVFKDGSRIATGTLSILSQYGLSETQLSTPTPTPTVTPTPTSIPTPTITPISDSNLAQQQMAQMAAQQAAVVLIGKAEAEEAGEEQ